MEENIEKLIDRAAQLPNGDEKIALLEEAIRIADIQQDIEQAYEIRMKLTKAATFSGRPEKAIASFAWCLAQYDQCPENFNEHELMWQYKWIVGSIDEFPQISKTQIMNMLEDLHKRYTSLGYSSRVYYQLLSDIAGQFGDDDLQEEAFKKWQEEPRDSLSNCQACDLDRQINYWLEEDELSKAYQLAQPIFNGELSCYSIPERTYASFVLPLVEEKRYQEAEEFFQRGYSLVKDKAGSLGSIGCYLEYLTVVNQKEAVLCMERHLPEAIRSKNPNTKYFFYLHCLILLEMLPDPDSVQFPKSFTRQQLEQDLYEIARQFDHRNQNHRYTERINDWREKIQRLHLEWKQEQKK